MQDVVLAVVVEAAVAGARRAAARARAAEGVGRDQGDRPVVDPERRVERGGEVPRDLDGLGRGRQRVPLAQRHQVGVAGQTRRRAPAWRLIDWPPSSAALTAGGITGAGSAGPRHPGPGSGAAVRSVAPACVRRSDASPAGRRAARPPVDRDGAAAAAAGLVRPTAGGACQPRSVGADGTAAAGLGHHEDGNVGIGSPRRSAGGFDRPAGVGRPGEPGPAGADLALNSWGSGYRRMTPGPGSMRPGVGRRSSRCRWRTGSSPRAGSATPNPDHDRQQGRPRHPGQGYPIHGYSLSGSTAHPPKAAPIHRRLTAAPGPLPCMTSLSRFIVQGALVPCTGFEIIRWSTAVRF